MPTKRMFLILIGSLLLLLSISSCGGKGLGIPALNEGGAKILSHNGYITTGIPGLWNVVVGEVENTGDKNLRFIKLEATFSDTDGNVSNSATASTLMNILLPGEKSPFYFTEYTNPEVKQYSLKIAEFSETDNQPYRDFEIVDHSSQVDEQGVYRVSGQVKNTGTDDAEQTEVFATFYGADGEVVAVAFTTVGTDPWLLGPGETETFNLAAYPNEASEQIVNYTLHVQYAHDPARYDVAP